MMATANYDRPVLKTPRERFMEKIVRVMAGGQEHWIWMGARYNTPQARKTGEGLVYGLLKDPRTGKNIVAHRRAYQLFILDEKSIPPGKKILHNHPCAPLYGCTDPRIPDGTPLSLCVNPSCLYESD